MSAAQKPMRHAHGAHHFGADGAGRQQLPDRSVQDQHDLHDPAAAARKSANVNPTLRKSFNRFYEFAKKHEETHRAIWLKCAAEAEAKVSRVVAKTCSEAEAQGLKIVEDIAGKCDARHLAFDASEQKRLVNHPFIKQVLKKGRVIASLPVVASRKTRAFETN